MVVILVGLVVLVLGADAAAVQSLRRVLDVTTITCNNLCFAANDGICEVGFFSKFKKWFWCAAGDVCMMWAIWGRKLTTLE